jgi:ABC-type dipeptide/oligopeptide/nickel transport system permease subunit
MFQVLAQVQKCQAFDLSGCIDIRDTLIAGINTATALSLIVAAIFMVIGAIKFITSSGDKGKADEAKNLLTNVLIGIAVILSINILFGAVFSFFGGSGGTGFTIPTLPTVKTIR